MSGNVAPENYCRPIIPHSDISMPPSQRALGAHQIVLAHDFGELLRPQPAGEGARRLLLEACDRLVLARS